jgi:hypothetical protein
MQKTKLRSGAAMANTLANVPSLLFSVTEENVVAGDGVATIGSMTDPISGAVLAPPSIATGFIKPLAGAFGMRSAASGILCSLVSGALPTVGAKHPLLIVVRHASNTGNSVVTFGNGGVANPQMTQGNSGVLSLHDTSYAQEGAVTFGSAGIAAYACFLDRNQATAVLAAHWMISTGTALKAIATTIDGDGIGGDLLNKATNWAAFLTGINIIGTASAVNNNIYGIHLLAFDNWGPFEAGGTLAAWLAPKLHWMANNPTKKLPRDFFGLT